MSLVVMLENHHAIYRIRTYALAYTWRSRITNTRYKHTSYGKTVLFAIHSLH